MDERPNHTSGPEEVSSRDSGLRERMAWIGDQIPVHPSGDDLLGVERVAGRRTRRRRVLTGAIGAGVLLVGAVVAVNLDGDDGGGDSIELTADESEQPPPDTDAVGAGEDDADGAEPPADEPVDPLAETPESEGSEPTDGADGVGEVGQIDASADATAGTMAQAERTTVESALAPGEYADARIVAWQDGFLWVETRMAGQPFPTSFSDDVTALFSAEVVELIQAEQPATINEATTLLSDAGLLDEVTQVLADHPEAAEAVYAVETPDPETTARFSRDGIEWEEVAFDPPVNDWFAGQGTHGDATRLVLSEMVFDQPDEPVDPASSYFGPAGPTAVRLLSTTDLVDWEVVEFPLNESATSEYFSEMAYPSSVAVSGDRFAIEVDRHLEANLGVIFADVIAERPDAFDRGFGTMVDDDGVTLELYDEAGQVELITVGWDELGMDPLSEAQTSGGQRTVYVGSFGGSIEAPVELDGFGSLVGIGNGRFLRVGSSSWLSDDGRSWVEIETLGAAGSLISLSLLVDDRVVAFGSTARGEPLEPFELDVDGRLWRPIDGPTLPARSFPHHGGGPGWVGAAALYQLDAGFQPEPFEAVGSIEVAGYTYTQTRTHLGESYSLTADGVEVVGESLVWDEMAWVDDDGPYEHVRFDPDGDTIVLDPESGDELVTISQDQMRELWMQLDRSMPVDDTYVEPEIRLIATDGERWIDEQITPGEVRDASDAATDMPRWATGVAVNGEVILVGFGDGSVERFEF